MSVPAIGPTNARVLIVGEAPGEKEVDAGEPFVGPSGWLLDQFLGQVGLIRSQCRITNVTSERPPFNKIEAWLPVTKKAQAELLASGEGVEVRGRIVHKNIANGLAALDREIHDGQPSLILCFGNTPLWGLLGLSGISSWRGSTLRHHSGAVVIPTYHPAAVLRGMDLKPVVLADLRRAVRILREGLIIPEWNFIVRPTFAQVDSTLRHLEDLAANGPLLLSCDIETRAQHITCFGVAWTIKDALCIPFLSAEQPLGYWTQDEEAAIVWRLYRLLTHANVNVVGQNFIYDAQYLYRYWHFVPRVTHDTMLAQHVCFPRMPKSLDFIASLYNAYYVYWKDDGKDWRGDGDEERYWRYNCEDCIRTLEAMHTLLGVVKSMKLDYAYTFQMRMWRPCFNMMVRGVDVDTRTADAMRKELTSHAQDCQASINKMVGWDLNPRSSAQMQRFFYAEMGLPKQTSRGPTKSVTCNDEALAKLAKREPLVRPIAQKIAEYRSCQTLLSNGLKPALGWDGKMHSSFNLAGTSTFRLSSSTDAFGSGMNLQNIKGEDKD